MAVPHSTGVVTGCLKWGNRSGRPRFRLGEKVLQGLGKRRPTDLAIDPKNPELLELRAWMEH